FNPEIKGYFMKRIGLVDIGSNTIRLVLFEYDESTGLKELQNIKTPARLAQFLNEDYEMEDEGIDNLISILNSFKQIAAKYDVSDIYPVATAAIRQSVNVDGILERVQSEVGMKDRKSTRLNSSHVSISYAVFCLKKETERTT